MFLRLVPGDDGGGAVGAEVFCCGLCVDGGNDGGRAGGRGSNFIEGDKGEDGRPGLRPRASLVLLIEALGGGFVNGPGGRVLQQDEAGDPGVVLVVAANAGEVDEGWDVEFGKERGGADAGELEDLGGADDAACDDNFFANGDSLDWGRGGSGVLQLLSEASMRGEGRRRANLNTRDSDGRTRSNELEDLVAQEYVIIAPVGDGVVVRFASVRSLHHLWVQRIRCPEGIKGTTAGTVDFGWNAECCKSTEPID